MAEYESEILSTHLDQIGLSLEQIQLRRRFWRHDDFIWNLQMTLMDDYSGTLHTQGSMAEGVGLVFLGSDKDKMMCMHDARVIHRTSEWELKPNQQTFLADTSDVHPGYCLLRVMHIHEPTFTGNVYNERFDSEFLTQNGPAQTLSYDEQDTDAVRSFKTTWPPVANEWIRRVRSNNFPPPELISSTEKNLIHVVQSGYKNSCSRYEEWRFSFSCLECDIIQLWPIKTLKCYVLLKLLKTEFNKQFPTLSHALCSYHMKTLLFWLVEETGVQYWIDKSLLVCLTFSLTRLLQCVEHRWLPHYFISKNNLFDIDFGEVHFLTRYLHVLTSDDKYRLYEECCFIIGKADAVKGHAKDTFRETVYIMNFEVAKHVSSNDTGTKFVKFQNVINKLLSSTAHCDPELFPVLLYMADLLKIRYCTSILSTIRKTRISNSTCFLLSRIAEQILPLSGGKYVLVQMANFWYQAGSYKHAAKILEKALDAQPLRYNHASMHTAMDELHTFPFHTFLKSEIHAIPYALQLDMYKTNKTPRNTDEFIKSTLAQEAMVYVDSLIYYLQYICYIHMGKDRHAQVAVDNLEWISKAGISETTLNLLGDCYLRRGELGRATSCFVQSIRVEPSYTSALIPLAITIGKAIRRQ